MSDQLSNALFIFEEQHNGTADTRKFDTGLMSNQFRHYRKDLEMVLQIFIPKVWIGLGTLFGGLHCGHETQADSASSRETTRAERDLVNEMIWSNPDAFASGLDVEYMMQMRRSRF